MDLARICVHIYVHMYLRARALGRIRPLSFIGADTNCEKRINTPTSPSERKSVPRAIFSAIVVIDG